MLKSSIFLSRKARRVNLPILPKPLIATLIFMFDNIYVAINGFGRIGRLLAKIALGVGMNVLACDKAIKKTDIKLDFGNGKTIDFNIKISSFLDVLKKSDFISLHVPAQKEYIINKKEFNLMKDGVGIINAARGGVINELELL
jgi:D-3-phosphoglycerate dehydrogenase